MKTLRIDLPTLVGIAATRGLLGVGVGLLLSPTIPVERRRAVGWTLFGIGVASTVPLAALVFRRQREVVTEVDDELDGAEPGLFTPGSLSRD
jgi:hypothetical protein